MDTMKQPRKQLDSRPAVSSRPNNYAAQHAKQKRANTGADSSRQTVRITVKLPSRPTHILRAARRKITGTKLYQYLHHNRPLYKNKPTLVRVGWAFVALLMLSTIFIDAFQVRQQSVVYALSAEAQSIVPTPNPTRGQSLKYESATGTYQFNKGYQIGVDQAGTGAGPKFTASIGMNAQTTGMTVTDPVNQVSLGITPQFATQPGQQNDNQLVYPVVGQDAQKVYTFGGGAVKEDIVLNHAPGDTVSYAYKLAVPDGAEARLEKNGDVAVYGANPALLGNVSTGSDADAKLLEKARKNSQKTTLLFNLPAPVVLEYGKKVSTVKAWFTLDGSIVTMHAKGLERANYPLAIDPSVYIETAQKLMLGNNESNIDFDVTNELIQKSQTTGARIDAWSSTNNLNSAIWKQGTAVAGGYIYSAGGATGTSAVSVTYYTAGTSSWTVPAGVSQITIKAWGGGGSGGAGSNGSGTGRDGGGGGYAKVVASVTAGDSISIDVGSGGAKVGTNTFGGNGGGASKVTDTTASSTLLIAGGGGGGGGARGSQSGGAGGAGGAGIATEGSVSVAGSSGGGGTAAGGGGRGTNSAGGSGGSAGASGAAGAAGVANAGGNSTGNNCATTGTGSGGAGGTGAGGAGGNDTSTCANGGGGGGGRYGGGGGGSAATANRGGGGGGGGSGYTNGSSPVQTAGSGVTPGNDTDADNNGAGLGGTGATTAAATTAGADGGVVITYTTGSPATTATVSWAHFNTTTNEIDSPNPGAGACTGWCTNSVYDLPTALSGLSLVAYNGYLYAIGGSNSGGTPQTTVYISKLGANGEPQLWHPTGGTPTYWYPDTALSAARSFFSAVAYNNHMYILGGLTTSSTLLSSNTVQTADIRPDGTLTTWTTSGMQALTSNRYGLTAQVYNDTLYVLGGDTTFTGTPITTVEYSKLNSDGTMNSWQTTSSMLTYGGNGRMSYGGSFSTIWGGYVYVEGGCTAVNGSGYCTSIANDVQLASINADGSLAEFNTVLGLTDSRIGHTLIAWQGGLYMLGGCRAQDSGTGDCTNTIFDVNYGVVNQEGEASTVANSVSSGTSPCSGGSPYGCDLPGPGTTTPVIGNVLSGSAIMNGYLYIWGGCSNTTSGCGTVSRGVIYTSVGSDGTLTKPASCGTWTALDSYCYNTTSLPTGGAGAPGVAIFNGYIYSVGGFTAGGMVGNIYYAAPSLTDGSISSWTTIPIATGTNNAGATSVAYPFAFARAAPGTAGTVPGNLYILGGCTGSTGIGCSNYTDSVYKCNINISTPFAYAPQSCTKTNQMQIGIVPGDTAAGLGAMAGTVYANYIYLMGGLTPNQTDIKTTRYAKIDNSNNIVDATSGLSTGSWQQSSNLTYYGRRRGSGFGYNGFLYVVGGFDGSTGGGGVLADIEFAKINVSDGSIGAWQVSSVNINERWGLTTTVSNSYAYVIGGCISGAAPTCDAQNIPLGQGSTNSVQTFQIYNNDSGALAGYSSSSTCNAASSGPCPGASGVDRVGGSSTIYNGYIYYAGGCSDMACSTVVANTYYASIDAYGVVGAWFSGGALPAARTWGKLVNTGGTLYYVGGQSGAANTTAQSTVYYTSSISSGNPTWGTATKAITNTAGTAQPRTRIGAAVWNNRIYVLGGYNASGTVQSGVFVSPQQSSGGNITSNWSSGSTSFNVARVGATAVAYANNLYIFGGNDGTNYLSDVQFSQINTSTGDAGSWTYSTSMPNAISDADGFAANGYVYIVGGRSAATTCRPITQFAPISANTTIASGNNPTGVGTWSETNQRYTGDRYGAAATYNQGRIYLVGGGCSSFVSSADRMYSSTLKSQPQMAKYSRMINTDTDVFPTYWLMNGLDNSIGARWTMRYRTMTDPLSNGGLGTACSTAKMTTWGQETNYGDVTLGTPAVYTPIDGSGANTHCARYFYFSVYIDASQTFGYPEDVTRGPTIADLSLFYTADPSKRLIHGKTFTGGIQQPLDTPF